MTGARPGRDAVLLGAGLAVGLILRWRMLDYPGGFDMIDYQRWGTATLDQGLAHAYMGIHFPLQYQVYELCVWLARTFSVAPFVFLKAANLPCDVATYLVLIAMLARAGVSRLYALVYWLHPWFLAVFALGYIDFQMTFCVLFSLWLLSGASTAGRRAIAGVPLAAAVLLKPQMSLPFLALAFYAALRWKQAGRREMVWFLAPVVVLGFSYETYFTVALWPDLGLPAIAVLPMSIVRIGSTMPVLTAHMPNVWYPLAAALKAPGAEIWTVSSKLHVLPHVQVRFVALAATVAVIAWYVAAVARADRGLSLSDRTRYILTFTTFIVPVVMTSAHENHLFIATVLFVLMLGPATAWAARLAIHAVLLMQAVNIEGLYGLDRFADWLQPIYSFEIRTLLSVVSVVCYAVIALELYRQVRPAGALRTAILDSAGG